VNLTPISKTNKYGVEWTRDTTKIQGFGIWTKFVEFLGVDAGIVATQSTADVFRFDRMQTEEYWPDDTFLTAAVSSSPALKRRLVDQRKAVFVIVGVKTVSGAEVKRTRYRGAAGMLEVAVDLAMVGAPVPLTLGPTGELGGGKEERTGFTGSDDFVFAYRVQKVKLGNRRVGNEKEVVQKDYVRGAMLGMGGDDGGDDELEGLQLLLEETLEESDVCSSRAGGSWASVQDGEEGEEARVFVPERAQSLVAPLP
jgi:hypothetical protein